MAIVIPSKNIYDMQNPKIVKNVVEKIEVNSSVISEKLNYDTNVFTTDTYVTKDDLLIETLGASEGSAKIEITTNKTYNAIALLSNNNGYFETTITVPKLKNNLYITKFKDEEWFKYQVYGTVKKSTYTADFHTNKDHNNSIDNYSYGDITTEEKTIEFPRLPHTVTSKFSSVTATITGLEDTGKFSVYEDYDNYYVEVKLLCYVIIKELMGGLNTAFNYDTKLTGSYQEYIPKKISVNLFGNLAEISIENQTIKLYSQGNENTKNVLSIDTNELIQNSSYSQTGENAIAKNYGKTLNEYEKGKETATLLCSISEYYNEQGELAISTKDQSLPMQFEIGNEVVPMIMNNKGEDVPMSKDKVFQVVGNEVYYDGAVWQKITLLQK